MKRKRLAKGFWSLLLVLIVLSLGGDTFGAGSPILQIARPHQFSIAGWEIGNFHRKWTYAFRELLPGSTSDEEEVQEVYRYFELTARINDSRGELRRVLAGLDSAFERRELEAQLDALRKSRDRMEASVERTLEGSISRVLQDENLFSKFLFLRHLWPPVDFHLADVPRVLIISPRDRIDLMETHLLKPGITNGEIEALEETIDQRNLSTLVERIAGVALYPSLVRDTRSLKSVLITAAHEWIHHYLFFHPLGWNYGDSTDLTTINETVADIVGDEIGLEVYRRYFATPEELEPPEKPAPAADEEPRFDFNKEMRETRLTAELLLAEGRIEEAEAYMEERRLFLAKNGHVFRKLNQAFFAFHGTFADRPGAVSPIGGQLRQLREESPTLSAFLFRVARFSSYDALKRDLGVVD